MKIEKIYIKNFKCFADPFQMEFGENVNIIVGDNEAGKSTILEAIHIVLTGLFQGRYLRNELSQYLFNNDIERKYISSLKTSKPLQPPEILIELFFKDDGSKEAAEIFGNENSFNEKACGIKYEIEFNEANRGEYEKLDKSKIKSIPIEYYKTKRSSFARKEVTTLNIPIKSALIDSSNSRHHNGSDLYISRIFKSNLEDEEKVSISQAHREMKESFMEAPAVQAINDKVNNSVNLTDKKIEISVDLATQNAWETSLMTYLDKIPFHFIGKGEQNIIKTALALSHKKTQEVNVILFEEPENHLSHSRLNELISRISQNINNKQIILSTHSSYVANKLGLQHIKFLANQKITTIDELSIGTQNYFRKLPGYDILRLILCEKAILVEGDCDELVIQKAYMNLNQGRLPIEDRIEVISVRSLAFKRFLEIADNLVKPTVVVIDNDGKLESLKKRYKNYLDENSKDHIKICFDQVVDTGDMGEFNYNTLEPKLLKANGLCKLNKILEREEMTGDDLLSYMNKNKTDSALAIFETNEEINFPEYILDAIK